MKKILLVALICFLNTSHGYKVAVVEYQPIAKANLTPIELLDKNSQNYIDVLKTIGSTDLVVFPEATLTYGTRGTPDVATQLPKNGITNENICNSASYPNFIKKLACAAKTQNVYIVLNLIEKLLCTEDPEMTEACPTTGYYLYNTDVVINRKGEFVAKYRKFNLFGEYDLNKPEIPTPVTFKLDDQIEFGVFTCFDILFQTPTLNLTRQLQVKNILFPTMWFGELPFLTALQTQQMWAYGNNVTFISSGALNPHVGSGGTAIFLGEQGALNYTLTSNTETRVLHGDSAGTAKVLEEDTDELAKPLDSFFLKADHLKTYTSVLLDTTKTEVEQTVCDAKNSQFCCNFKIKSRTNTDSKKANQYTYHLVAFSGVRSFSSVYNGGIDVCGVVACLDGDLGSCGKRFADYSTISWPITFEHISIQSNFSITESNIQFPNSLLSSLRPISPQLTKWTAQTLDNKLQRTYSLEKEQNRLMTFAIYGRDFTRDSAPTDEERAKFEKSYEIISNQL